MNKIASDIFDKLYQSYTMGGDVYCFKYNTKNPNQIERFKKAIYVLKSFKIYKKFSLLALLF